MVIITTQFEKDHLNKLWNDWEIGDNHIVAEQNNYFWCEFENIDWIEKTEQERKMKNESRIRQGTNTQNNMEMCISMITSDSNFKCNTKTMLYFLYVFIDDQIINYSINCNLWLYIETIRNNHKKLTETDLQITIPLALE